MTGRPSEDPLPSGGPPVTPTGEQAAVTRRYQRMAWLYDIYNAPTELLGIRRKRRRLLQQADGTVLEIGVGTGKNLPHYPPGMPAVGIDVSSRMLRRARRRAARAGSHLRLLVGDAHRLPFESDEFDTAVATCVFCSVADPVRALRELGRVTRPGGHILLLEHVRPRNRLLGWMADVATVVTRRLFGFRANRRTEDNVAAAGLEIAEVRRSGIWREIVARPGKHRVSESTGEKEG